MVKYKKKISGQSISKMLLFGENCLTRTIFAKIFTHRMVTSKEMVQSDTANGIIFLQNFI